ncbi:hypothetical protein HYC85_013446 [Camellia sinensis]|uniref:Uncharacterized protein n=1 Tax=Camellia sinensis TaxID=4442 RepID=A0A7J7H3E6_CAMSI|nr:hypothetical protein HYC85_013446 [Camellia sinensis]
MYREGAAQSFANTWFSFVTDSNSKASDLGITQFNCSRSLSLFPSQPQMAAPNNFDLGSEPKPQVIYRCKKCRRIVASQEHVVPHERGEGQKCFKWRKRSGNPGKNDKELPECSSIFVEPMKWMEAVQDGGVEEKIQCMGCKARLGSFNWAGMQCNCGAWVNPAFQLHKNRIDECQI